VKVRRNETCETQCLSNAFEKEPQQEQRKTNRTRSSCFIEGNSVENRL
jgi:hypothetical protein